MIGATGCKWTTAVNPSRSSELELIFNNLGYRSIDYRLRLFQ